MPTGPVRENYCAPVELGKLVLRDMTAVILDEPWLRAERA
jgi:hypothetical protein